ncbi:MAG TPA: hypothetical protein VKR06_05610 [Ktedonosporobacter sp.]|nr:hypothetical protein [Ktedonosporobacter sp.]
MYCVQIILLDAEKRQILGLFDLSTLPHTGEFLLITLPNGQPVAPEQKLVQIQEIIYAAYPISQRPENPVDAILIVFPKPPAGS